jgi:hypothetical protein
LIEYIDIGIVELPQVITVGPQSLNVESLRPLPRKAKGENMKKEILKGFTMLALILALALVTAVATNAQSSNKTVADIPFEFSVGDQAMPSGRYAARTANTQGNVLMIQSNDAKNAVVQFTNSIEPDKNKTHARLVFHRYGERYFLAEVWSGSDATGRQLLKSRQERSAERELAAISTKSDPRQRIYETVEVLASNR